MVIQDQIEKKLKQAFSPTYLKVINESGMHNVPKGSESHFKVIVVSEKFEGERLLTRHRKINSCLSEELENNIHALAIHTYTECEWRVLQDAVPASPICQGGSKL